VLTKFGVFNRLFGVGFKSAQELPQADDIGIGRGF
jgi:hypothetical protein